MKGILGRFNVSFFVVRKNAPSSPCPAHTHTLGVVCEGVCLYFVLDFVEETTSPNAKRHTCVSWKCEKGQTDSYFSFCFLVG